METENLLSNIKVIEDEALLQSNAEMMTFSCKLLSRNQKMKKRYGVLSTQFIDFFENKDSDIPTFYDKLDNVEAIYINELQDQIVLKRNSVPNVVIKTRKAADLLRMIYGVRYCVSPIPIFELPEDSLEDYYEAIELPDRKYEVPDETNEKGKLELSR